MSEAAADPTADLVSAVKILPEFRGESSWEVPKEKLLELMRALKKEGMTYLVDITAVDNHGEDPRFEMVYELCDLTARRHLRGEDPGFGRGRCRFGEFHLEGRGLA